jgi:hypothetical protein
VEAHVATLTKREVVLDLDGPSEIWHEGRCGLRFVLDDEGARCAVHIDHDTWEDMGSPPQLTVTIEPGDTLNG